MYYLNLYYYVLYIFYLDTKPQRYKFFVWMSLFCLFSSSKLSSIFFLHKINARF